MLIEIFSRCAGRAFVRTGLSFLSRLSVLLFLLLSSSDLRAEGEPLSGQLRMFGTGRSGAPTCAEVTLIWNGTSLLEGDLHLYLSSGNATLLHDEISDIALAPGSQTFSVLLPGSAVGSGGRTVKSRMIFRTANQSIELENQPFSVPNTSERALSILYPSSVLNSDTVRDFAIALRLDGFNPDPGSSTYNKLRCGVSAMAPSSFPSTPEEYCAFDLLVLTGDGVARLREAQLNAIYDWLRGGGSILVVNPGILPESHQQWISKLFVKDGSETSELFFDTEGRPQGPRIMLQHHAGGRVALMLDKDCYPRELKQDKKWRRLVTFLWKFRPPQQKKVVSDGFWSRELQSKRFITAWKQDYYLERMLSDSSSENMEIFPKNLFAHNSFISAVMPKDMNFISIWHLALVLIVLVVFIGPVDYFLLRRFHLQRFTWLTVPLYVTVATAVIIVMANYAMGVHNRRGRICVLDTDVKGVPVKQNDFSLYVSGRHGTINERVKNALVAPVTAGIDQYGMNYTSGSDYQHVRGRYPHDYEVVRSVEQWRPAAWRTMTLRPTEKMPWVLPPEGYDFSASAAADKFWNSFIKLNGRSLPQGAYFLESSGIRKMRNARWMPSVGDDNPRPENFCTLSEPPRIGYFSVVSSISPACDPLLEDMFSFDISDDNQVVLLLVWRKGEEIFVSKTSYYRDSNIFTEIADQKDLTGNQE